MKAIFHCDRHWGIGRQNDLMFSLPKDMKFFRETTIGKIVIMGRNTLLSFPNGKPLKNRVNIVLSPTDIEGVVSVHDLGELFGEIKRYPPDDVYVIGGASVYKALIPYCNEILVTKVDADGGAEMFVPNLDLDPDYECIHESDPVEDNGFLTRYCLYKNRNVKVY